jgi:nucleoid-associated protein YgaU
MANMSSYADANRAYRRSRYYAPPVPKAKAARIKIGLVLVGVGLLWLFFIQGAYGGGRTGTEQVTVQPGQTVWSIAAERYPDDDTRSRVTDIVDLNHLDGAPIYEGEKLTVPAR